jgi:signal transduction histidine kinase
VTELRTGAGLDGEPTERYRSQSTSLRSRLTIAFVIGGLIIAMVAGTCAVAVVHLVNARHVILGQIDPASLDANQLELAYVDQESGVRGYLLSSSTPFLQPYSVGIAEQRNADRDLATRLSGQPHLASLLAAAERSGSEWQNEYATPVIAAVRSHDSAYFTKASLARGKQLFDQLRTQFSTLDNALSASRHSTGNALKSATTDLIIALCVGAVIILVAGIALERALRLWVTEPLFRLGSDAREVASGDLGHPIGVSGPPEVTHLALDVEAMRRRIVSDLEDVARAHAELDRRNEDLARSNVELEQFAYVASHDLQEPLRKVTSFAQLLQQRYGGQLDERADQYIEFAVDGAKRMQALINDLLTFSRVGRTTEGFVDVDLNVQVSLARSNLESVILDSGARIEVGPLPVVVGDPVLLGAVWQNLIGNAIKFKSADEPHIQIEAIPRSDDWLFTVTDNGIGIEPHFADKIFVIFQRLHSRDAYSGTGIGLALCKKIVEFHGGTIWVDTDRTTGARLCFTLPAVHERGTA